MKARDFKREAWMSAFLAAVIAQRGEWANPLYRPQDFWDTAVYLYNSGKTPDDAATRYAAPKLCKRTVAVYRPGVPMEGVHCTYTYTGSMPLTGSLRCYLCGEVKQ